MNWERSPIGIHGKTVNGNSPETAILAAYGIILRPRPIYKYFGDTSASVYLLPSCVARHVVRVFKYGLPQT